MIASFMRKSLNHIKTVRHYFHRSNDVPYRKFKKALDRLVEIEDPEGLVNRPDIVGDSTFWENTTMKRQTYTPEIKERAVRMLIEVAGDYPSMWSAIQAIAP